MPVTLAELRNNAWTRRSQTPAILPAEMNPTAPENFTVTGKEGFFRCQWAPALDAADGYQIAVSSSQNIDTPDIGLFTVLGIKSANFDYAVGNIALTRYFAIRSFTGFPPRYFSDFTSVSSATSVILTGAGSTEPAAPYSPPRTTEPPPSGVGVGSRVRLPNSL